jgi:hypothetical protein
MVLSVVSWAVGSVRAVVLGRFQSSSSAGFCQERVRFWETTLTALLEATAAATNHLTSDIHAEHFLCTVIHLPIAAVEKQIHL